MADKMTKPENPSTKEKGKEKKTASLKLDVQTLKTVAEHIAAPIKSHHALIMFVLLMGVLIYSVYSVSTILQTTDDPDYRVEAEAKSLNTTFDQSTIQKVDELRESDANDPINLPGGRRNPFVN
jgi:hypothetical protein